MSIDIWTDSMQHAELFGKPVLFTNLADSSGYHPPGLALLRPAWDPQGPNAQDHLSRSGSRLSCGDCALPHPFEARGHHIAPGSTAHFICWERK